MNDLVNPNKCSYCLENIANIRVICRECEGLTLCLTCHSFRDELGSHNRKHSVEYLETFNPSDFIFLKEGSKVKNWTVTDEILLLKNINVLGYNNWSTIGEHLGKSPEEIKQHFTYRYMDGIIGKLTWVQRSNSLLEKIKTIKPEIERCLPDSEIKQLEYNPYPRRNDVHKDYFFDMDAEQLITNLVGLDDSELKNNLKMAVTNMYIRRLRERTKRECMIHEYQLIEKFFQQNDINLPRTKDHCAELEDQLVVFTQLTTSEHFKILMDNLKIEDQLKNKIRELYINNYKKSNETLFYLLTDREKEICKHFNFTPIEYVTLKTKILKDHFTHSNKITDVNNATGYDSIKIITNYLISSGIMK